MKKVIHTFILFIYLALYCIKVQCSPVRGVDNERTFSNIMASADPPTRERIRQHIIGGLRTNFESRYFYEPENHQLIATALAAYHDDPRAHVQMLGSHDQSRAIYRQYRGRRFAKMKPLENNNQKKGTKEKASVKKPSP